MKFALLLITDGRDEVHQRAVASLNECLPPPGAFVMVDDRDHELGFAGAVAEGWRRVLETDAEWVFHCEGDFIFHAPIPISRMIALLERRPYLAQVAMKRQAWNPAEIEAGGVVELHRDDFEERSDEGATWTEHRRFWTTNPSVYSTRLCRLGWPEVPESEGMFTHRLLEDPLLRFAFWGAKFDPPTVEHIGLARAGHGY